MDNQIKPHVKYFGNYLNLLVWANTRLGIIMGTSIEVKESEENENWEFVLIDSYDGSKRLAVF